MIIMNFNFYYKSRGAVHKIHGLKMNIGNKFIYLHF